MYLERKLREATAVSRDGRPPRESSRDGDLGGSGGQRKAAAVVLGGEDAT